MDKKVKEFMIYGAILSTIQNADVIYAIKNGKILEKGTHYELLKLNGYYAGLVKSQIEENDKNQ